MFNKYGKTVLRLLKRLTKVKGFVLKPKSILSLELNGSVLQSCTGGVLIN